MRGIKFKIVNYRIKNRKTLTLTYEQALKELEVSLVIFYLLKSKNFMIKTCIILFIKHDVVL